MLLPLLWLVLNLNDVFPRLSNRVKHEGCVFRIGIDRHGIDPVFNFQEFFFSLPLPHLFVHHTRSSGLFFHQC